MQLFDVSKLPFEELYDFDARISKLPKTKQYWQSYLKYAVIDGIYCMDDDKQLNGLACIRRSYTGYKIAPWYATSKHVAKQLLIAALNKVKDYPEQLPVDLNAIRDNSDCMAILEEMQFVNTFDLMRMWTNPAQGSEDTKRIYSMWSLEIG